MRACVYNTVTCYQTRNHESVGFCIGQTYGAAIAACYSDAHTKNIFAPDLVRPSQLSCSLSPMSLCTMYIYMLCSVYCTVGVSVVAFPRVYLALDIHMRAQIHITTDHTAQHV